VNEQGEELLKFPTDYPIKVVGRASDELRARVHAVMLRHVPEQDITSVSERLSGQANYLAISYVIRATSREQVVALVNELKAADGVMATI
jgi:uncharacterized protein